MVNTLLWSSWINLKYLWGILHFPLQWSSLTAYIVNCAVFHVYQRGTIRGSELAIARMRTDQGGSGGVIINVASICGEWNPLIEQYIGIPWLWNKSTISYEVFWCGEFMKLKTKWNN